MKDVVSRRDLLSDRYKSIYGEGWIDEAEDNNYFAYRINTSLYTKQNFLSTLKIDNLSQIFFINDTIAVFPFRLKESVSHLPYEYGFILNLSSFIPPLLLNIEDQDNILDICAAPGVKTSLIYLKAKDNKKNIELTAVEKDQKRFFQMNNLLNNLFGKDNIKTINIDARSLNNSIFYDKVLSDVPCSAEGEMLRNKDYSHWNSKLINSYTNSQKAILAKAISLLKSGGQIIYSTCTLSPEENEEVIDWALKRFDIELNDIQIPDMGIYSPNIVSGITEWGIKKFDNRIEKSIRIVPNGLYEGFFVTSIQKN